MFLLCRLERFLKNMKRLNMLKLFLLRLPRSPSLNLYFSRVFYPKIALAIIMACFWVASFSSVWAQTGDTPHQALPSVAKLAADLSDAVVNISILQTVKGLEGGSSPPSPTLPEGSPFEEFFQDFFSNEEGGQQRRSRNLSSQGSGFVIDAGQGLIVTNNHVIAEADEIEVNFSDGVKLKATLIGKDSKTDLALIKVDPTLKTLKQVTFGNSDEALIGDWVLAIGNPFGLGGTVTLGIISARNRNINAGPYDDFIQTDAAINRGNSGGPLFNMKGEVIGVNTAIISPSGGSIGIGFAIPSQMALGVISQLKQFGQTRRGRLGIRIQPVTEEIAASLHLPEAVGALVSGRIDTADIDNSALQAGDVIIRFAGKKIKHARDLPRIVSESAVGQIVDIVVFRAGQEETVTVTLGLLDEGDDTSSQASSSKEPDTTKDNETTPTSLILGMQFEPLDEMTRQLYGIALEIEGVVVTFVEENSVADNKRIEIGNVIIEINQERIASVAKARERLQNLRTSGRKNALLLLAQASGELRLVTLRLD